MATTERIASPKAASFTDSITIATSIIKINKGAPPPPPVLGGSEIKCTSSSSDDQNKKEKYYYPTHNNNPHKLINSISLISNDLALNPISLGLITEPTNRGNNVKSGKFAKNVILNQNNILSSQHIDPVITLITTSNGEMETLNSISKYNCVAPSSAINRAVYKDSVRGEKKKGKFVSSVDGVTDLDNRNISNLQSNDVSVKMSQAIIPDSSHAAAPPATLKRGKNQLESCRAIKKECGGEQPTLLEDEEDPYAWGEFGGVGDLIIDLDANIEKSLCNNNNSGNTSTVEKEASTVSGPKMDPNLLYQANGLLVASKSSNLKVKIKRKTVAPTSPITNSLSIKGGRSKITNSGAINNTTRQHQSSSSSGYNEIVTSCCNNSGNSVRAAPNSTNKICLHKSMPPHPSNTISSLAPSSSFNVAPISSPSPFHPPNISSSNGNGCDNIDDKLVTGDIINYADKGKLLTHTSPPWLMNGSPGFKRLGDEHAALHCPQDRAIIITQSPSPSHSGDAINSGGLKPISPDSEVKTNNNTVINRLNVSKRGIANDNPLSSVKFSKQRTRDSPTPPSSPLTASPKSPQETSENARNTKQPLTTTMSPGLLVGHTVPHQSMCLKLPATTSQSVKIPGDLINASTLSVERGALECRDQSTSVEEHLLGPCEPGTVVSLNGVVWQENTASGMLVLNITWRGLNYVGTLMDTCKVKWAPPKLGAYNHHGSCGSSHKQHHGNNAHHLSSPHTPCTSNRTSSNNNYNPTQPSGPDSNVSHTTTNPTSSLHTSNVISTSASHSTLLNCCNLGASNTNLSPSMAAYNMGGRVKRTRAAVAAAAAALASALAEATKTDSSSSQTASTSNTTTTTTSSLMNSSEASSIICDGATTSIIAHGQHQLHCTNALTNHQSDQGLERCNFFLPQSNARRSALSSSPRQATNISPARRECEVRDDDVHVEEGTKRLCLESQAICSTFAPNTPDELNDAPRRIHVKCPVPGCCKSYDSKIAMEFHLNRCHDQGFSEQEWQTLTSKDVPSDELQSKCEVSQDLTIVKEEFSIEMPENSVPPIEPSTIVKSEMATALSAVDQQSTSTSQPIQEPKSGNEDLDKPLSSPISEAVKSTVNSPPLFQPQDKPQPSCHAVPSITQSGREVIDPSDPFSVLLTDPRYREQMGLSLKSSTSPPNALNTTTGLHHKMSGGRHSYSADSSTSTPSHQQQCNNHKFSGNGVSGGAKLTYQLSQDSLVHTLHKSQASSCTPFQDHLRMLQLQSRLDEPDLTPSSFGPRTYNSHHPYYFYDTPHGFSASHPSSSSSSKLLFPYERYKLDRSMSGASNHLESSHCGNSRRDRGKESNVVKGAPSPSCPPNRPGSQTPPGPYDFVTGNEDLVGKIRLVDPLSNCRTAITNRTICANTKIPSPHAKFPNTHQGTASKLNGPPPTTLKCKSPPHGQPGNSSGSSSSNNFSQYLMPPLGCVESIPSFSLHQQLVAATANYHPSNINSIPFPSFNNYSSPGPAFHYFPGYPPIPDPNASYNGNQGGPGTLIPPQMMDPYMAAALFANQHETMAALAASGLPTPFYHVPMAQHGPSSTPTPAQPSSHHYNK